MIPKQVLVIGAGPAGMQASLDLADMGVPVHLVERQPSIGGRMAQIDTIFPTDCEAGCRHCALGVVSGEPTDCSQHPNITLHTCSEVEQVTGAAGDFTVRLKERARHVDIAKCTACAACAEVCPVTLPDEYNEGLSDRKAIYRPHAQAIPATYLISRRGVPQCETACPAGTKSQAFIALIAQGRYEEALEVIRRDNPFPATVGRVCDHVCESECERAKVDEPVAICALMRFAADWVYAHSDDSASDRAERPQPSGKRVTIVGAGPAGLSAAHFLARAGYRTDIYEASSVAGGMMRLSIPSYSLPRDVLQREIDDILSQGVELHLYHPVSDIKSLFDEGSEAVLIAMGAHKPKPIEVPGADAEGVHSGLSFLEAVSLGQQVSLGERVVVIGDGNTAVYAARSALRLGARQAVVASKASCNEMRATVSELVDAEDEGVRFEYGVRPVSIMAESGKVSGTRFERTSGGAADRGAATTSPEQLTIGADTVIYSVSCEPETAFLRSDHGLEFGASGTITVDPTTLATTRPGVFAAGDVVRGPNALIQAIADGRRAARSIDRYLRGEPLSSEEDEPDQQIASLTTEEAASRAERGSANSGARAQMPKRRSADRVRTFEEVELGLSEEQARAEAQRCLACGDCADCGLCLDVCEEHCIDLQTRDECVELNVGAIVVATGFDPFDASVLEPFGYGRIPNVITSLEYERLLSGSGPTQGRLMRPSDGGPVKEISFIQCVGSRDVRHNPFCSSVCCMFATQEAIVAHRRDPEVQSTIYYRDLRAANKGADETLRAAREDHGVRYVRSRVGEITTGADGRPVIWYDDIHAGSKVSKPVDLVVLVMGLIPKRGAGKVSNLLGIDLDDYGFVDTDPFMPTDTSRPGVFTCGFCRGPANITESVAQASAAAARAAEIVMAPRFAR